MQSEGELSLRRNELYKLMISQLEHDGFGVLAVRLRLTGVIDDSPPCPPSNRLMELVKLGLEEEQLAMQDIFGVPPNSTEEFVVNDWNEDDMKKEIQDTLNRKVYREFPHPPFLKSADVDKMVQVKIQQIMLVGSKKIYDEIDNNFRTCTFNPLFAKEQFDLYEWREKFFNKHFPHSPLKTYHCNYNDTMDMEAYNITEKFDAVVALATCDRSKLLYVEEKENPIDWRDSGDTSYNGVSFETVELDKPTKFLFDRSWTDYYCESFESPEELDDKFGSYKGALSLVAAAHPSRPQTLEHIALKKFVSLDIPLQELPPKIRIKVKEGMFHSFHQVQDFITDLGKQVLEGMRYDEFELNENSNYMS